MGYTITGDGGEKTHFGPKPFEASISDICEMFDCDPETAKRQDPQLIREIIEFRAARQAIALFNDTEHGGPSQLADNPAMTDLILEMKRAQES